MDRQIDGQSDRRRGESQERRDHYKEEVFVWGSHLDVSVMSRSQSVSVFSPCCFGLAEGISARSSLILEGGCYFADERVYHQRAQQAKSETFLPFLPSRWDVLNDIAVKLT